MKTNGRKAMLAISALFLGAFLFRPVSAFAGQYENYKAQDLTADLNLAAVLNASPADLPAVSAPSQVIDPADAKAAAASLPDFAQVASTLYRSGQPTQAGIARLKSYGIKTILKLNADAPAETTWAAGAGLDLETVLMSNKQSPTFDQVDAALAIINDPSKQPVLVHCHLGHDRTGAVIGAYRVTVQGWSVDKAAAEAKSMGYSDPSFQDITAYLQGYAAHAHQPALKTTSSAGPTGRSCNTPLLPRF